MAKVSYRDFDSKKLSIVEDAKTIYKVHYDGNPLRITTPKVKCLIDPQTSDDYIFVDLSCPTKLAEVIEEIDYKVMDYVTENSESILSKKRSRNKVEDMMKFSVRGIKNRHFRARMHNTVEIYDKQKRKLNFDDSHIKKDDQVQVLLRLDCVRAAPGTIKCNWYIDQFRLDKDVSDCLLSDSENESESEDSEHDEETVEEKFSTRVSALTDDSY